MREYKNKKFFFCSHENMREITFPLRPFHQLIRFIPIETSLYFIL